ncbi:hypothetical protein [Millisia brevis]|nr:hypothetical protein [Millisia brevis]
MADNTHHRMAALLARRATIMADNLLLLAARYSRSRTTPTCSGDRAA